MIIDSVFFKHLFFFCDKNTFWTHQAIKCLNRINCISNWGFALYQMNCSWHNFMNLQIVSLQNITFYINVKNHELCHVHQMSTTNCESMNQEFFFTKMSLFICITKMKTRNLFLREKFRVCCWLAISKILNTTQFNLIYLIRVCLY